VSNYRFSNNGIERKINIPVEVLWDNIGRDDAIDIFEQEVLDMVINPIDDVELARFEHKPYSGLLTNINYDFYFMPNAIEITAATTSDYSVSYTAETFTVSEIYQKTPAFSKSFFKLDLYDTVDRQTQRIMCSIVLPTQQGLKTTGTIGFGNTAFDVDVVTPSMILDYVGDKEGFFIYFAKDFNFLNIDTLYMSAKFFNGKNGEFSRMLNTPQTSLGNRFNFESSQKYYYKVLLDYDNYEYEIQTLAGQRIGTSGNPIKWYEYVNP
jgi:hypothetical protein